MSFDNPYEILGVKETDNMGHIDHIYRGFVKLLHPDRANTTESERLGMSKHEKTKYFGLIKNAYKLIRDNHKDNQPDYPDYPVQYEVDTDHTINFNHGLTEDDAKNFNHDKFNKIYMDSLKRDSEAGMSDPFSNGYEDFNTGKDFSGTGNVTSIPSYTGDISVEKSKHVKKPGLKKSNKLVEYVPSSSVFEDIGIPYQELGLTNVSDFSMSMSGKGAINGTDLMSVYGKNVEPWEKTFQRDKKLYSKFTDTEEISSKASKIQSDRGNIYNLPLDKKMIKMENNHNLIMKTNEKMRNLQLSKRDEYFDDLNMGRLENGLPSRQ